MTRLVALLAVVTVVVTLVPAEAGAGPGPGAARVERRLNELHCDAGRADGRVDRHTRSAVVRFQSRVGIPQTGKVGERTRRRLNADSAPRCDRRPVPAHSGRGRRIVVSQRQNWVWLVGPTGQVAEQGGMVDNDRVLRRGSYAVGSYCGRPARIRRNQSTSGSLWLDNFVRFAPCGVGFHRIPRYKSTGRQIHPDWILGTNQAESHGCIRLSRALSLRVWELTARPTRVWVV